MAVYSELIKNFEKIREYVRDFYIFGFHTRESFDAKSKRTYDNEKRRIESWLSDHVTPLWRVTKRKYLCRWIRGTFFKTHCISAIVQRPLRTMISVALYFNGRS